MIHDPDDELLSLAKMGIDAEAFLRTKLGQFILDKASREITETTQELIAADPDDIKLNRDLRNRIHVANMVRSWLSDAVALGRAAHDQLIEIEDLQ